MHSLSQCSSLLRAGFLALGCLFAASLSAANFPGGFIEQPGTVAPRPLLTKSEILGLLPQRGPFTFPAPYDTEAIRITNADDCGGSDCVNYVGYSYWRNINNHLGQDTMLIFVGLDRSRGGAGPSLFEYNKISDEVTNLGPLFDSSSSFSWATAEGWYFSATMPNTLYMNSDASLLRYDVISREFETVFNVTNLMGSGYYIWQVHSSADDRVHSATLRDQRTYDMLGCVVYREDTAEFDYYPRQGDFDECQIDKSGNWLLIKEDIDGIDGEDNLIINLQTGQQRILLDRQGAAGHSDMGYGYMIAADNWANDANTQKLWKFDADTLEGVVVYHNADWNVAAPAHMSHSNAVPGTPAEQQYACGSSVNRTNSSEANEIICFGLDGSGEALVVAPVMTDLSASGGGDDYAKAPKGNLDVTGKYFIWTSNMGGSRLDLFVVKVPGQLLTETSTASDPTPDSDPTPSADPDSDPAPAPTPDQVWSNLVNTAVTGATLSKTGGCDGCADASAVSQQEISSGDGFLEFTADEIQHLRYIGLSTRQAGTGAGQIDFALGLQAGYAEVRENGVYRADTPLSGGDVLQVSVQAGKVHYARNGKPFYTSTAAPVYPLRAYTTLFSSGSTISNAVVAAGANAGDTDSTNSTTTDDTNGTTDTSATMGQASALAWFHLRNAAADGNTLSKTKGCDGCADAGAVSRQEISGDGYLEFTVDDTQKLRYTGLSVKQQGTGAAQIDFALRVQAGYAEVRENGTYRADTPLAKGDVLRISVQGGKVTYTRNGKLIYTSTAAPNYPQSAYAVLFASGSRVSNAFIATGN